jgi:hypothetical protein
MAFILYFVIKVQSNSKYDNELVVEEYYKHDAKFGDEMIRVQNAHDLTQKPLITKTNKVLQLYSQHFSHQIKSKVKYPYIDRL